MTITVNSPRIRALIREMRKLRAQGKTKAAISTYLSTSGLHLKSAERTAILADVPA